MVAYIGAWARETDPYKRFELFVAELAHHMPQLVEAFAKITQVEGDQNMAEAAYTEPTEFPGYINVTFEEYKVVVTLRPSGAAFGATQEQASLDIPIDDWDQLVADVARIRGRVPVQHHPV